MRRASAIVSVIVVVLVLLGALGVGLVIKHFRSAGGADGEPAANPEKLVGEQPIRPGYGANSRSSGSTEQQRAQIQQQRGDMLLKWENMSDEEREKFRDQMRRRFSSGPAGARRDRADIRRGQTGEPNIPAELREKLEKQWQGMSEAERQFFRAKMREEFEAGRKRAMEMMGRYSPEDGARTREREQGMMEQQENVPEN